MSSTPRANAPGQSTHASQKRKAEDSPNQRLEDSPVAKQRKTSPPAISQANGRTPGSESSDSPVDVVRPDGECKQTVEHLERWYNLRYPDYTREHAEITEKLRRGEEIGPDQHENFMLLHYKMKDYKHRILLAQTKYEPLED
jgi:hypothetical protein